MRERIPLAIIMVTSMSMLVSIVMAQPPMPPSWFYGTVIVEGSPAQDNLNVTAAIRGTNLTWTTQTKNGTYGWTQRGSSSFYIPSDYPTTPDKDGGVNGDVIEFSVNGVKTNQTATFEYMSLERVDLAVGSTPEDNGGSEPAPSPLLLYAALVAVMGIGLAAVLWIHRKGYLAKVLRREPSRTDTASKAKS